MALLQWTDKFRLGIDVVDREHRELVDLINRLHDAVMAEDANTRVTVFFERLLVAMTTHFASEEEFMRASAYDQLERHQSDHERILEEIRDIMNAFEHAEEIDSGDLGMRLEAWFARHFEAHDAPLHRRLGAHPH